MKMISDFQVCGVRLDLDYQSLILPKLDESTGKYACPENYIICGPDDYLQSHHDTIICLSDAKDCPVTNITFTKT